MHYTVASIVCCAQFGDSISRVYLVCVDVVGLEYKNKFEVIV